MNKIKKEKYAGGSREVESEVPRSPAMSREVQTMSRDVPRS